MNQILDCANTSKIHLKCQQHPNMSTPTQSICDTPGAHACILNQIELVHVAIRGKQPGIPLLPYSNSCVPTVAVCSMSHYFRMPYGTGSTPPPSYSPLNRNKLDSSVCPVGVFQNWVYILKRKINYGEI